MYADLIPKRLLLTATLVLLAACSEQTPPTAVVAGSDAAARAASLSATDLIALQATDPFTIRAPLDPYRIHQLPDFMIHSSVGADLVIQRLVLPPGSVPWHTHPGPSFVIVEQGNITLSQFTPKTGCIQSPVLGPGQTFYRAGNEIHRLTVVGAGEAVLYVARFNIPVGGAITIPADDPGC
jgi:quercetin dioxygenase-like cupin family protein